MNTEVQQKPLGIVLLAANLRSKAQHRPSGLQSVPASQGRYILQHCPDESARGEHIGAKVSSKGWSTPGLRRVLAISVAGGSGRAAPFLSSAPWQMYDMMTECVLCSGQVDAAERLQTFLMDRIVFKQLPETRLLITSYAWTARRNNCCRSGLILAQLPGGVISAKGKAGTFAADLIERQRNRFLTS